MVWVKYKYAESRVMSRAVATGLRSKGDLVVSLGPRQRVHTHRPSMLSSKVCVVINSHIYVTISPVLN